MWFIWQINFLLLLLLLATPLHAYVLVTYVLSYLGTYLFTRLLTRYILQPLLYKLSNTVPQTTSSAARACATVRMRFYARKFQNEITRRNACWAGEVSKFAKIWVIVTQDIKKAALSQFSALKWRVEVIQGQSFYARWKADNYFMLPYSLVILASALNAPK